MAHKAGFVNIVGKPNVGKSTLINLLIGEKLSIVTQKAQTTRHRIYGIINGEDYQIVFSDTPGLIEPKYLLQEKMMRVVKDTFKDADVIIVVTDIQEAYTADDYLIQKVNGSPTPVLVMINKIDTSQQSQLEEKVQYWQKLIPRAEILPISALFGFNVEFILPKIIQLLPENPPYYSKEIFTTQSSRFFVTEALREQILLQYDKEIPYAVEAVVELFKETEDEIKIESVIYVERDSQKGIIIGKGGQALQKVRRSAVEELEKFFEKKIQLNLFVKVKKDWRKKNRDLDQFGY